MKKKSVNLITAVGVLVVLSGAYAGVKAYVARQDAAEAEKEEEENSEILSIASDDVRDTVNIESLLTTSDSAYSKKNVNSGNLEKEDGDVDGPFDLGVSITETVDDEKETHIIYYSTSNLLQSQVNQMVSGGNEKLVMASLSSLVDTEDGTTVSIPSKSLEVSYLTMTAYDASFWKICTIGLIPGAFLLIGFMIWLKRRKA